MKKEMLINVLQPEECRIAILEDNELEELYMERKSVEAFAASRCRTDCDGSTGPAGPGTRPATGIAPPGLAE